MEMETEKRKKEVGMARKVNGKKDSGKPPEGFLGFKCSYCGAFAKPEKIWTCWKCGKSQL